MVVRDGGYGRYGRAVRSSADVRPCVDFREDCSTLLTVVAGAGFSVGTAHRRFPTGQIPQPLYAVARPGPFPALSVVLRLVWSLCRRARLNIVQERLDLQQVSVSLFGGRRQKPAGS